MRSVAHGGGRTCRSSLHAVPLLLLRGLALCLLTGSAVAQLIYYVHNNAGAGGDGSIGSPFTDIRDAMDEVDSQTDAIVYVAGNNLGNPYGERVSRFNNALASLELRWWTPEETVYVHCGGDNRWLNILAVRHFTLEGFD
eukprot:TRINITY_DN1265_c1_g1_i1.p2 TRINITY_DN1265_c1_g1~~TRINITY_DN1265_c1_g1_i1.p2  ORF type:complete len:140 (-),score=15.32 TRINITY_DN1265_c1_g1_i1:459-878(-)